MEKRGKREVNRKKAENPTLRKREDNSCQRHGGEREKEEKCERKQKRNIYKIKEMWNIKGKIHYSK
jgi:hypothetical protein